jgi:4-hydroxy-tetrahydrodipicolinate synthase
MTLFQGLSAFPLTPTDSSGKVDVAALARLLERLCVPGIDSVGVLGSTGVYAYLTREERLRAIEAAAACVRGRIPLIVGVGALRTDDAQGLARDAASAGADALLLAPVSYTPLTQDEVFEHFRAVATATDLPICIYNNPSTTHFAFGRDLLERLSAIETVQAAKMPLPADGDFAGELAVLRDRTRLSIGYSGAWGAADALLAGADAWYSVIAGIAPRAAISLFQAARPGGTAEAHQANQRFLPLWETFRRFGSLRVTYALLDILSLGPATPPRPLLPLDAEARDQIADAFDPLRELEEG